MFRHRILYASVPQQECGEGKGKLRKLLKGMEKKKKTSLSRVVLGAGATYMRAAPPTALGVWGLKHALEETNLVLNGLVLFLSLGRM